MERSRAPGLKGSSIVVSVMVIAIVVLYLHGSSSQSSPTQRLWNCGALSTHVVMGRPFAELPSDAQAVIISQHENDRRGVLRLQARIEQAERLERKRPDDAEALDGLLLDTRMHSALIARATDSPQDKYFVCDEVPAIPKTYWTRH